MMSTLQRGVAVSLVLCLVLLSGPVYALTVQHATHHAHHKAATHATVLCSLLCSAGQVLEAFPLSLQVEHGPVSTLTIHSLTTPTDPAHTDHTSRGPPLASR